MARFSETLTEHVMAPRNAGVMEDPDLTGHAGTPGRGAFLILFLKVQEGRIAAAKYQTHGCGPTIAAGSMFTERVRVPPRRSRIAVDADRGAVYPDRGRGIPGFTQGDQAQTMATVTEDETVLPPAGPGLVLHDVPWGDYLKQLQIVGKRHVHVTYDEGTMEVRMPSQRHEQAAQLLGLFIPRLAEALEVDYEPLGMTTWRRPDLEKGLESDQCYYLRNAAVVRQRNELDLERDPPPDLAVEVDITSSSLDRMAIYAELRVPEVWRYDGRRLTIYVLQPNGQYRVSPTSPSFPGLQAVDIERFLERGRTSPKLQWSREIAEWVRNELVPRRNAEAGNAKRKRRTKGKP